LRGWYMSPHNADVYDVMVETHARNREVANWDAKSGRERKLKAEKEAKYGIDVGNVG